jgi:type II secretory pathway component GspD/PulD (secretin)
MTTRRPPRARLSRAAALSLLSVFVLGLSAALDAAEPATGAPGRQAPRTVMIRFAVAELIVQSAAAPGSVPPTLDQWIKGPAAKRLDLSVPSEKLAAQLPALDKDQQWDIVGRGELTTLERREATVQLGRPRPKVAGAVGSAAAAQDPGASAIVGLSAKLLARVNPDHTITMEIDIEKSELGPVEEGIPVAVSPNGRFVRVPALERTGWQTIVSGASGEVIVLGGLSSRTTDGKTVVSRYEVALVAAYRSDDKPAAAVKDQ